MDNNNIYDVNNQNLYLNLEVKEIFEWLYTTNEFLWKLKTDEEKEQYLQNKIKQNYKSKISN
jgi:hypothetical protein